MNKKVIETIKNDPLNEVKKLSQKELENLILKANNLYYNDIDPLFNDETYDLIKDYLEENFPDSDIIKKVGAEPTGKKVKLPFYMGSMKKLKPSDNSIENWLKKYTGPYVLSDKLDGTSGMLYIDEDGIRMFTRGSHDYGRDISHLQTYLVPKMKNSKNILKKVEKYLKKPVSKLAFRGEIILTKEKFQKYRDEDGFKSSSRSIVNALVIRKHVDKKLATDADYMLFEVMEPRLPKDKQFELLEHLGLKVPFHNKVETVNKIELSKCLEERREKSEYDIDGIIVENNGPHNLSDDSNPDYAFAYKQLFDDQIFEVTVTKVEYEASKDGILVPTVSYEPINYKGDILKRATGFNAKFIKENGIGTGAKIKIIRAGEIIPYIQEVTKKVEPQMPLLEYEWNESGVDAILKNISANETVKLKLLVNFFTKLEFPFINRGILEKFVKNNLDTIDKILNVSKDELLEIEGFKEKMADKIYQSINDTIKTIKPSKLMGASNSFGKGFGERKIKQILEKIPDIVQCYKEQDNEELIEKINSIEGFQEKTSTKFVDNLENFCKFLNDNSILKELFYKTVNEVKEPVNKKQKKNSTNSKLENLTVVMTGFRDKDVIQMIEENGGKITNTITGKVDVLITKDKESGSSKVQKAEKLNIKIFDLEEFRKNYL